MATLRDYFDTDFTRVLNAAQPVRWQHAGMAGEAPVRVHLDFHSNAKFLSCYLPAAACQQAVPDALVDDVGALLTIGNGVEVQMGLPGELPRTSRELRFAGRVSVYHERGLREARKCKLIITPNFIGNRAWTREEFNAIFTRELVEQANVILPVWHNVTRDQVFAFSPVLADRLAVNWNVGADEAVRRLRRTIGD